MVGLILGNYLCAQYGVGTHVLFSNAYSNLLSHLSPKHHRVIITIPCSNMSLFVDIADEFWFLVTLQHDVS